MKELTDLERDIVKMRYFDRLYSKEIADKLSLTVHQVKYRLRKATVKNYIRKIVVPKLVKPFLEIVDARLANPAASYAELLVYELNAKTYIWVNGKKHYYDDNRKQFRSLSKLLRITNVAGDQKNIERDLRKAIAKHIDWLKEMRRKGEKALETGEIHFC